MEKEENRLFIINAGFILDRNRKIQTLEDLRLINKYYDKGEADKLGELLERYLHLIFGLCMRYLKNEREAKDHTQQVCLEVISAFQKKRQKIIYFKSWIYQVTKNHCLMHLRAKSYQTVPFDTMKDAGHDILPDKKAFYHKEQQYRLLEEALETLKKEQRKCIQLFYYEQRSYKEIVEETNYSVKQVKSFLQNGRRNIRIFMERQDNE